MLQQAAEPLRLFFALWPPDDLQAKLAAWADKAAGKGRAMRRENIHLTLAFLGATDPDLLPVLTKNTRAVRFAPIRLMLDRVGYWKHNRIIWCGTEDEPQALTALVADLRAGLDAAGIRYDPKPFVSHVTLVRKSLGLGGAPRWVPLVWEVRDFALVRSVAIEGGVSYQVLQRFPAAAN
ncbi:MAG: RNA 2',3'-cyclic phosphodiesterase [Burkholderiales bacterium]|nr:RNA 2',3'-cyclic phosphodiesterase [Burkholderiales bacterium]